MSPAELAVFGLASPANIVNALSRASANFRLDKFLHAGNSYQVGVGASVKNLMTGPVVSLPEPDLAESIAVSAILHLYDGWSYLAEALKATFRTDDSIARHLAYYAELRASLSVLASHGVGVFSSQHVVVGAGEQIHKFCKGGTHLIAWEALEEWSKTGESGSLIGSEILAFGKPLNDWIMAFQGTSTPSLIGVEWVEKWGIDLSSFSADRQTRNEVSYGVDFNHLKVCHTPKTIEPWLREIWLSSEPGGSSFALLDKYLVRSTLESIYETKFRDPSHTASEVEEALTEMMMDACMAIGLDSNEIVDFFTRDSCKEDLNVMKLAKSRSAVQDPLQYQEVLSRAFLLLRLSSASVKSLLRKANLNADDLSFWWTKICESSGLWGGEEPLSTIDEVKDLWADTSVSLDEFNECLGAGANAGESWHFFNSNIPKDLENLSRVEKVALWGIS